jgi:hypothetical protein
MQVFGQITEESAAALGAIFLVPYIIFLVLLDGRLSALHAAGRLNEQPPPLLSTSPFKNFRALAFVYSQSPWQTRDAASCFYFYVVRIAFAGTIGFFLLAMWLGLRR